MITRPMLINEICGVANIQRDVDNPIEGYFTRTELEKLFTFIKILKDAINSKAPEVNKAGKTDKAGKAGETDGI